MKTVQILFSSLTLSLVLFTSCNKEEIIPVNSTNTESVTNKSVLAPQILANSVTCTIDKSGLSKFNVNFNQVTANFYGSNVYLQYKSPSSSTWTTAIAPSSYLNPNAVYTLNVALAHGIILDVRFKDSPNGNITSPVYQVLTPQ